MKNNRIFLSVTGDGIARACPSSDGGWIVEQTLTGTRINCLAADSNTPGRVFAGSQSSGVLVSQDYGNSWQPSGLPGMMVKSLAVSPHAPGTIYAGCKPVSLFASRDGGKSWLELDGIKRRKKWWWLSPAEPPDFRPYIQALAVSPADPQFLLAGIELGGVLRSTDGGQTWSKHCRGAVLDCHSLKFHPTDGNWIYQGGGTGAGAAFSRDGGATWQQPDSRFAKKYGWMVAADPGQPGVWYLSASPQPNFLRGEFAPPAHIDGQARAHIYRMNGAGKAVQLEGGLPQPLAYMAYALLTDPEIPGYLVAGLSNGDLWHTADYGDSWEKLPLNLGQLRSAILLVPADKALETGSILQEPGLVGDVGKK